MGLLPTMSASARCLFQHTTHTDSSQRLVVYQVALTASGTKDMTKLGGSGSAVFFTQLFSQSSMPEGTVPIIPGFAVHMDTGIVAMVDEQEGKVHLLACTAYAVQPSASSLTTSICNLEVSPVVSKTYGAARYQDIKFVGKTPYASTVADPLATPAKMFFTTLENILTPRAELYVQCAKCKNGGITSTDSEALSENECFCLPGYMLITYPQRGCEQCRCRDGQYLDLCAGLQLCITSREMSMPGCLPCSATCDAGSYVQGSCNGTQTANCMECVQCTLSATESAGEDASVCPAASRLPVRRGLQTVIYSASQFRSDCINSKGLDCMRRQSLMYPFDGNDLLEDLAPWARRLMPVSVSGRSKGPTLELIRSTTTTTTTLQRTEAA